MLEQLLKLVLITNFGRGSYRPQAAALQKLLFTGGTAIFFGLVIGSSLTRANFVTGLPAVLTGSIIAVVASASSGLLLLVTGNRQAAYSRQTGLWPLGRPARWLLHYGAKLILLLILLGFGLPMALAFSRAIGLPIGLGILSLAAGLLGGFGASNPPRISHKFGKFAACLTLIVAQVKLLDWSIQGGSHFMYWGLGAIWMLLILSLASAALTYFISPNQREASKMWRGHLAIQLDDALLRRQWFLAKVVRNHPLLISFAIAFLLSLVLSLSIWARQLTSLAGNGWLVIGALLTSSVVVEWRGGSRRHKPAEVVGLSGVRHFVASQLAVAWWAGILLGLPLWVVVALDSPDRLASTILFVALQWFAVVAGLAIGALFVPEPDDTGTQFLATVLAMTLVLAIAKYVTGNVASPYLQSLEWIVIGLVLFLLTHLIETKRRLHYGRI